MTDGYTPTWITSSLCAGHAPMSYDDLEDLKRQGIDAILNLCGEYCDLHELEHGYGFEVHYLPIPDENAPDIENLENALDWLDEAIYLGKRVLVHCRFGMGRTGTLVTAYLLRKGLGLKQAAKLLKRTRANPSTYGQHKFLKKYSRREKPLTIREPALEARHAVDLSRYFEEYEALVGEIDSVLKAAGKEGSREQYCGNGAAPCCHREVDLSLIEAVYLYHRMNRHLNGEQRLTTIKNALTLSRPPSPPAVSNPADPASRPSPVSTTACILGLEIDCPLYDYRPLTCRLFGVTDPLVDINEVRKVLQRLSNEVFFVYSGFFMHNPPLRFSLPEIVSGRFVQTYFYYLAEQDGSAGATPTAPA